MYLVTGGAGFIGSNIVAALSDAGFEVAVCDWLRQDERWRNLAKHKIAALIDPDQLDAWLEKNGSVVAAVIHMGANSSTTELDVDHLAKYNIRATLSLLEWCTETGRPLIFASSAATYGDGTSGFDDEESSKGLAKLRPLNAYGWSKHLVDRRIAQLVDLKAQLPPQWVGLKFFNVYGPNEYHKGSMKSVVAQNFEAVRNGQPLRLFKSYRANYADGGQMRDFIYVRDCVDVVMWLLDNPSVSGLFNLGTGKARSWLDLAHGLFSAIGSDPKIEFIDMPEQIRQKYQYFTEANMTKLYAAGYRKPMTSLEDGINDYVLNFLTSKDPYR